jgi:SAM-dependent methyltransferase/uncharacterized protein YbaR (Trm112 family)
VRRRHFESLRPVCPVCRAAGGTSPLRIAEVVREHDGHIVEGVLHCSNDKCLREFPILDGIPLIIANIRQYVSDNILAIHARRDLGEVVESMLGDCCGPGSAFDQTRQYLSSYAWDHYGDLDPNEPAGEPRPGSMLRNLHAGFTAADSVRAPGHAGTTHQPVMPLGPVIDVGCSVGRGAFELAERTGHLVLGTDLNFAMLRVASEVLRNGVVRYPRRRTGLVYDRREFPARFPNRENVDFWGCDATALPFESGVFSLAVGMNVLDSVAAPRELLVSIANVLKTSGHAILTCPYDWSAAVTPVEAWLGGHSQRSPHAGSCETALRALLTPGAHPGSVENLKLVAERENLEWHVRLHDRSSVCYRTHLVVATKS